MKKGQIVEGIIERVDFPNKGILRAEDGTRVIVKNAIMGQKVSAAVNKVRKGKCEGRLLEVLEKSALERQNRDVFIMVSAAAVHSRAFRMKNSFR